MTLISLNHDLRPLCVDSFVKVFKLDFFEAKYVLRWTQPLMHHFTASTSTLASHSHRSFCLSSSTGHVLVCVSFRNSSRLKDLKTIISLPACSILILKQLLVVFVERLCYFMINFLFF
jgi:hypothetical protein